MRMDILGRGIVARGQFLLIPAILSHESRSVQLGAALNGPPSWINRCWIKTVRDHPASKGKRQPDYSDTCACERRNWPHAALILSPLRRRTWTRTPPASSVATKRSTTASSGVPYGKPATGL